MEYKSTLSQLHKRIDQCLKKQQQSHQDEEAHRPPQLPLITQLRLFKFFKKKKETANIDLHHSLLPTTTACCLLPVPQLSLTSKQMEEAMTSKETVKRRRSERKGCPI